MRKVLLLALVLVSSAVLTAQSRTLDVYWIDVEGCAATLLVAPSGESLLYDAGWEARPADAAEMTRYTDAERKKWHALIKARDIKLD